MILPRICCSRRTIRAAAKQDISHRDRKDHKDLAGFEFNRATSALGKVT